MSVLTTSWVILGRVRFDHRMVRMAERLVLPLIRSSCEPVPNGFANGWHSDILESVCRTIMLGAFMLIMRISRGGGLV